MGVFIDKDGALSVGPRVLCEIKMKVFLVDGFEPGGDADNVKESTAVRENLRKYLTHALEEAVVRWNVIGSGQQIGGVELHSAEWQCLRERMEKDEKGQPTVRTHRV